MIRLAAALVLAAFPALAANVEHVELAVSPELGTMPVFGLETSLIAFSPLVVSGGGFYNQRTLKGGFLRPGYDEWHGLWLSAGARSELWTTAFRQTGRTALFLWGQVGYQWIAHDEVPPTCGFCDSFASLHFHQDLHAATGSTALELGVWPNRSFGLAAKLEAGFLFVPGKSSAAPLKPEYALAVGAFGMQVRGSVGVTF